MGTARVSEGEILRKGGSLEGRMWLHKRPGKEAKNIREAKKFE
jgi:hypothetical protein